MVYKITFFLLIFSMFFSGFAADESLTILDTGNTSAYLQEFFGKVFNKENIALPQDIAINIIKTDPDGIKHIPLNSVIADDGLTLSKLPEDCSKNIYAYLPVILAVHKNNPLEELDIPTLQRIYSGRGGDWSRIGGKAGKIILAGYPEASAIGRVFRKSVMQQDLLAKGDMDIQKAVAPDMITCHTPEAATALVQSSENVIVYGGAGLLENSQKKYKILKINGVFPSRENILSGKYKTVSAHAVIYSRNNPPARLAELLKFLRLSTAEYAKDMLPVK